MSARRPAIRSALAALALFAAPAIAEEPARFYLGATAGVAKASLDPDREAQRLSAQGLANPVVTTDERGHAVKAFVGMTFTPNVALEAGLFSLRTFEYRGAVSGGTLRTENYVYGYHLDVVAGWPMTDTWRLIGRVGLLNAHAKSEYDRSGTVPSGSLDRKAVELGWKAGIGVEYALSSGFSVRGEWERYRVPDGSGTLDFVDALSTGLFFRF